MDLVEENQKISNIILVLAGGLELTLTPENLLAKGSPKKSLPIEKEIHRSQNLHDFGFKIKTFTKG